MKSEKIKILPFQHSSNCDQYLLTNLAPPDDGGDQKGHTTWLPWTWRKAAENPRGLQKSHDAVPKLFTKRFKLWESKQLCNAANLVKSEGPKDLQLSQWDSSFESLTVLSNFFQLWESNPLNSFKVKPTNIQKVLSSSNYLIRLPLEKTSLAPQQWVPSFQVQEIENHIELGYNHIHMIITFIRIFLFHFK